ALSEGCRIRNAGRIQNHHRLRTMVQGCNTRRHARDRATEVPSGPAVPGNPRHPVGVPTVLAHDIHGVIAATCRGWLPLNDAAAVLPALEAGEWDVPPTPQRVVVVLSDDVNRSIPAIRDYRIGREDSLQGHPRPKSISRRVAK